jgi:hypothetical protein
MVGSRAGCGVSATFSASKSISGEILSFSISLTSRGGLERDLIFRPLTGAVERSRRKGTLNG